MGPLCETITSAGAAEQSSGQEDAETALLREDMRAYESQRQLYEEEPHIWQALSPRRKMLFRQREQLLRSRARELGVYLVRASRTNKRSREEEQNQGPRTSRRRHGKKEES